MVSHLEVNIRRAADWENAITTGYQAWRQLHATGGGTVELDMHARTLPKHEKGVADDLPGTL